MEKDNRLLIIEKSDNARNVEESSASKMKLALASKKLKDDFLKENEFNKTSEIMSDDYENEIDKSLLEMEQTVGLAYESDNDETATTSNGNVSKRRTHSSSSTGSSEDDAEIVSAKNSQLIESSVLQRKIYEDYQLATSVMLPFYNRRRLSECIEESESEEEVEAPAKPAIVVTPTNGSTQPVTQKKRFTVTKTQEEPVVESPAKQPVSILKKSPSPPSNQKLLQTQSPKKIRYEAQALKDVSAQKNSQTIHFPCSSGATERTSLRTFFSPQGFLNPHLDPRFFDTSLVEIRASQTLTNSSKSLNEKPDRQLDDNVWIKRNDGKPLEDKTRVSNDSIDRNKNNAGESVSLLVVKKEDAANFRIL